MKKRSVEKTDTNEERKTFPWATYSLLTINIVYFIITSVIAWQRHEYQSLIDWLLPTFNTKDTLIDMGALTPQLVWSQPWRLVTCAFLHDGLIHMAINGFAFRVAAGAEKRYGWRLFLCLYIGSSIVSGFGALLLGVLSTDVFNILPVFFFVGASGALWGTIMANSTSRIWEKKVSRLKQVVMLIVTVLIYAVFMLVGDPFAHLAGAMTGLVFATVYARVEHKGEINPAS